PDVSQSLLFFLFFHVSRNHRYLHSFPTRRSSDLLVPFLDRSKGRGPLQRPFFTVVGALAVIYFLAFTALILFNIAVIERDPLIIMNITLVVLVLGLLWELRYRRRLRQAALSGIRPPVRAPAHG